MAPGNVLKRHLSEGTTLASACIGVATSVGILTHLNFDSPTIGTPTDG